MSIPPPCTAEPVDVVLARRGLRGAVETAETVVRDLARSVDLDWAGRAHASYLAALDAVRASCAAASGRAQEAVGLLDAFSCAAEAHAREAGR